MCSDGEATTWNLVERDRKAKDLELMVRLLTDETGSISDLQKRLYVALGEPGSVKQSLEVEEVA